MRHFLIITEMGELKSWCNTKREHLRVFADSELDLGILPVKLARK